MGEPQYRLEGIVHTRSEVMEDFEGPLDVIFELLSTNKIKRKRANGSLSFLDFDFSQKLPLFAYILQRESNNRPYSFILLLLPSYSVSMKNGRMSA